MRSTPYPLFSRIARIFIRLRNRHFALLDILAMLFSPCLALYLRTDGQALERYAQPLALYTLYALGLRLFFFWGFGFYSRYWRFASIDEVVQLAVGGVLTTAAVTVLFFGLRFAPLGLCSSWPALCGLPRSLPLIDGLLLIVMVAGTRLGVRASAAWLSRLRTGRPARRVLIMGAGSAGAMIAREMRSNPQLGLEPVGFVDDDMHKHDVRIQSLMVLGGRDQIPALTREYRVAEVIIAMPTAPGRVIREIVTLCDQAGVKARIMPGIYELLDGTVTVSQLRDVDIEDLLRREPVKTDTEAVLTFLQGKRVLVTGGGGSIGSELCRQIWRCRPAELILLGHGENSIFNIYNELAGHEPDGQSPAPSQAGASPRLRPVIADIRIPERLDALFAESRPQIVFHAAAHKHVPLMEHNPAEAVTNNILGTRNLLATAQRAGVERFVMISTDKAVNPTSIMGASKRAAELLVQQAAERTGRPYVAVRFGNVLGSRGSVIHTFKQQIVRGGPVTVTHPEMKRYFMIIPEAVQLVLQAALLGEGGETFVLDMGEPVKIVDLARDLIELSGLEVGQDIEIAFSGMRSGEKLFEELFIPGEAYHRTRHEKIFTAGNAAGLLPSDLDAIIDALAAAARRDDKAAILRGLKTLIAEFDPAGDSVVGKGRQQPPPQPGAGPAQLTPRLLGG